MKNKKSITHKYKVDIRWSNEDDAYIARVPELAGVVTHGDSVQEAAAMAEEAIELHLESLVAHKEKIPTPIAKQNLKGRIPLRIEPELHQDLFLLAEQKDVSVNSLIKSILLERVSLISDIEKRKKA